MPQLSPTADFEHKIKWSIGNFDMCPPWANVDLASPEFIIRLLDDVTLRLYLRVLGPGKGMLLTVKPEGNERAFERQSPSISVLVSVTNAKEDKVFHVSKPSVAGVNQPVLVVLDLDPPKELDAGTLVLQVTLTTTVDQGGFWSEICDPHLVAVSNDLCSLVYFPKNSDMVMVSAVPKHSHTKGVRLDAHSSIIRARMPVVFKGEVESCDSEEPADDVFVLDTETPTEAMRTAMYYIYGRLVTTVPNYQIPDLRRFAQKYEMKDLENMLKWYPTAFSVSSSLNVEETIFSITVNDIKWDEKLAHKFSFDRRNIKTSDLQVTYSVDNGHVLLFSFEFIPQALLHMKCVIEFTNRFNQKVQEHVAWHTFTEEKSWTLACVSKDMAASLDLVWITLRVLVTDGRFQVHQDVIEETDEEDYEGDLFLFNNLLDFSDQLKNLYLSQEGCDLEIDVGLKVFRVHKVIVMTRCCQIREKVQSKEDYDGDRKVTSIKMQEFLPDSWHKILIYIYSGSIELEDSNEANMINLAEYLYLPHFVDYCYFREYNKLYSSS